MMRQENELRARIGSQAERFIKSELGAVVLERANILAENALLSLAKIDPKNEDEIRKLQNEFTLADRFKRWLHDIIEEGEVARIQLKNDAT